MKKQIYLAIFLICGLLSCNKEKTVIQASRDASGSLVQPELPQLSRIAKSSIFELRTTSRSYFAKDDQGRLIPELINGKKYYKQGEDLYNHSRLIYASKTALIVMDPWEDSGSPFLNNYNQPIIKEKIIPLICKSVELGIPVIVLTNKPQKDVDYGSKIFPDIDQLVKMNKILVIYHQDTNSDKFKKWLTEYSVDTLIYCGFASNMCVIGLDLGMVSMRRQGFRLFFVPEASAAIEFRDSWKTGTIHHYTTVIISQWLGEIIALKDYLALSAANLK